MWLSAQLDPAMWPNYLASASRVLRRRVLGPRHYEGDAAEICRAVVDACWAGDHYNASAGHFRQAWTRDHLLARVWGYDYYGGSRTVDIHVRRIRAKLGFPYAACLMTVRHVGYKWVPDELLDDRMSYEEGGNG